MGYRTIKFLSSEDPSNEFVENLIDKLTIFQVDKLTIWQEPVVDDCWSFAVTQIRSNRNSWISAITIGWRFLGRVAISFKGSLSFRRLIYGASFEGRLLSFFSFDSFQFYFHLKVSLLHEVILLQNRFHFSYLYLIKRLPELGVGKLPPLQLSLLIWRADF